MPNKEFILLSDSDEEDTPIVKPKAKKNKENENFEDSKIPDGEPNEIISFITINGQQYTYVRWGTELVYVPYKFIRDHYATLIMKYIKSYSYFYDTQKQSQLTASTSASSSSLSNPNSSGPNKSTDKAAKRCLF